MAEYKLFPKCNKTADRNVYWPRCPFKISEPIDFNTLFWLATDPETHDKFNFITFNTTDKFNFITSGMADSFNFTL